MSKVFFICGTDTDAGKTVVCAALLYNMPHSQAIKIVQTGEDAPDENIYAKACPQKKHKTISRFKLPASPHMAAAMENKSIDLDQLAWQVRQQTRESEVTLLEGSGGIMTPLSGQATFLDLMALLDYPAILVVNNRLGAINQALLSLAALQNAGLKTTGIIFTHPYSGCPAGSPLALENISAIRQHGQAPVLGVLPHIAELAPNKSQDAPWALIASHLKRASDYMLKSTAWNAPRQEEESYFDQKHLWHPYSPAPAPGSPTNWLVKKCTGNYIHLQNGQKLLDGMASWWSAIHGYGRPELTNALKNQASQMPHVMFGGLTHKPAIELGESLLPLLPQGLEKIFWADSGSVAVEVALKMALQYWQGMGVASKKKIISHYGGYHGDTFGAMSVGDPLNGMHSRFNGILPEQIFVPRPASAFNAEFDENSLCELVATLEHHHRECAAIIIEPIVQGAGGMWIYHPQYLRELAKLCRQYDLLLIYDEIATGFGRTGKMFAGQWAGPSPDIMCLGKALTGGAMTMAAAVCSAQVAEGISRNSLPLMHGPTFMGNPLACRVAKASVDLLLSSGWRAKVSSIERVLSRELAFCRAHSQVKDVRVLGAIGVVEMKKKVNVVKLRNYWAEEHGVWLRPFNNLIYLMPPYTVTDEECASLGRAIREAITGDKWV